MGNSLSRGSKVKLSRRANHDGRGRREKVLNRPRPNRILISALVLVLVNIDSVLV